MRFSLSSFLMITSFLFVNIKAWTDTHIQYAVANEYSMVVIIIPSGNTAQSRSEKEQGKAIPGSGNQNYSHTWVRSVQHSGLILFLATERAASAPFGVEPAALLPCWYWKYILHHSTDNQRIFPPSFSTHVCVQFNHTCSPLTISPTSILIQHIN